MRKIKVLLETGLVEDFLKALRQAIAGVKAEAKLEDGGKTIVIVEFPETQVKALDEVLNRFNGDGSLEVEDMDAGEDDKPKPATDEDLPDFELETPAAKNDELRPRGSGIPAPRRKTQQANSPRSKIGWIAVAAILIATIAFVFAWAANSQTRAVVTSTASIAKDVEQMSKNLKDVPKKVQDLEAHFGANGDVTRAITDVELLKQEFGKGDKAMTAANNAQTAVDALTADDGAITDLTKRVKALEERKVASAADVSRVQASAEWAAVKAENEAMLMKLAEVRRADPNCEIAKLLDDDVQKALKDAKKRATLKQQIETAWLNRPAPAPQAITQKIVPEDNAIPKLAERVAAVEKTANESHEAATAIATSPKAGLLGHSVRESNKAKARAALGIVPIEETKPVKPPKPRRQFQREF